MKLIVNATGMNSVPFTEGVSETGDTDCLTLAIFLDGGPYGDAQLDRSLEQKSSEPGFEWLKRSGRHWSIDAGRLRNAHRELQTLPWFKGQVHSPYQTEYGSVRGPMGNLDSGGQGLQIVGHHQFAAITFMLDAEIASASNSIFYSWMSDRDNFSNRGFIQNCLEKAVKEIGKNEVIGITPALDRDTKGEAGSPDIAVTIFRKIEKSRAFVADVTLIQSPESVWRKRLAKMLGYGPVRPCPNPNVLVELGYAAGCLGWDRCLLIINTAFGDVEQLPFDLRGRRVLPYRVAQKGDRATAKESFIPLLQSRLAEALQFNGM